MIVASAPGKLMLAGEYAIVGDHGPALAIALSLRIEVTCLVEGAAWRVSSRALALKEAPISSVPVLAAALKSIGAAAPAGGHLVVESELGAGPQKPGFGSSAALAVAGLAALREASGLEGPTLAEAVAVHRSSQGGKGSGYDVAAALYGGVTVYRGASGVPRAEALAWLDGLCAAVIYTGRGASTPKQLGRLSEAGKDVEPYLLALGHASSRCVEAWRGGSCEALLEAAKASEHALNALDERFQLGIGGGGIREARTIIESVGAVARTSGAGGGDCLWALAADNETLASALRALEASGARPVALTWPGNGLEMRIC